MSREQALAIWQAAVDAVRPEPLVEAALRNEDEIRAAPRILVVGAGKAGPGMALGLEAALADRLDRVEGLVNVPEGLTAPLKRVRLHAARPQGVNEPTPAGVGRRERDAPPARDRPARRMSRSACSPAAAPRSCRRRPMGSRSRTSRR